MKTVVTCCLASYRVAAAPPVSVGLLPAGVKHGGVFVVPRGGVVQPAGGAHSHGVPPSQLQVHALAGGGAALEDSNVITDGIEESLTLTIPVYQTAPTGRTWLWVHQARGASNVSEGFAI